MDEPRFDPFTGVSLIDDPSPQWSPSARAGLEAPRFCGHCGRRMVVRINPMGWSATCSRHGELSSAEAERSRKP